jgi:tRNA U34 5-carboxymethylaminomethyl modifying GTPase MnmE/TrmE
MGLAADIIEVTGTLQREVLDLVSHEAVLDADVDTDFAALSDKVLTMELEDKVDANDDIREQTQLANEALGELSGKSIREDLVATIFSRFCVGK